MEVAQGTGESDNACEAGPFHQPACAYLEERGTAGFARGVGRWNR